MVGLFNTGINFWQAIGLIFAVATSIIAVRVTLSFDFNKYLERQDDKNVQKLKNACSHLEMTPLKNRQFQFKSLFESPPGTQRWQCQRCGLIRNHNNDYKERTQYFADHPDKFLEQRKKFQKLLKESGML